MNRHRTNVRPLADLLWLFAGPSLWFAHFTIVYGAEALICLHPTAGDTALMIWIMAGAGLAAIAALVAVAVTQARSWAACVRTSDNGGAFLHSGSALLALLSLIGVTLTTLPVFFLGACVAH